MFIFEYFLFFIYFNHTLHSKYCVVYIKASHNFFMLAWPKTWWAMQVVFETCVVYLDHCIMIVSDSCFLIVWFLCVCRSQEDVRSGAAGKGSVAGTGSASAVPPTWRNTCSRGTSSLCWSLLYWITCVSLLCGRCEGNSIASTKCQTLLRNIYLSGHLLIPV